MERSWNWLIYVLLFLLLRHNTSAIINICRQFVINNEKETIQKILQIVKENGIVRPLDLDSCGLPRQYLSRLYRRGLLTKTGRGLYAHPDAEPTELRTLAAVSKRVPEGVVCLVSALQYHELTTQMPPVVWLAIDRKARMPQNPKCANDDLYYFAGICRV